jgi:hypothetical protein
MSANDNSKPDRPDMLVGRKLPAHSLWEQLQRRAQPLALEFCSSFLNNQMGYKEAKAWLEGYGIKVSKTALQGFYNSLDIRLRFAAVQAAESADTAKAELPADLEAATKERIAQHKFELAFMNLGENQRLQLIQIQQNEEGMKGNLALNRAKLDLDLKKFLVDSNTYFERLLDKAKELLADNSLTQSDRIAALRKAAFADVEALEKSGKLVIPK